MSKFKLIHGDCLEKTNTLISANMWVDSVVTDPPYGLKFMGKDWDHGIPGKHFWEVIMQACKPGAHLLAFGGTRTFHRLTCAIEDAGWEIRDCIMWTYGQGFPKSHNVGNGFGTALKPAWEPIILARKPLDGTVAANVQQYGTGALNINGCRVKTTDGYIFNRVTQGGDHFSVGSKAKTRGTTFNPNNNGRWPSNLIHDGSEEVVELFPNVKAGVAIGRNASAGSVYGNGKGLISQAKGTDTLGYSDSGSAARFFYCAKASNKDRNEGLDDLEAKRSDYRKNEPEEGYGGNDLCARLHKSTKRVNHHPTVKPTSLMRYLCKLVTPPNGIVFDPFMGSGSTGKAAVLEGFSFIGIDTENEYVDIAKRRIIHALKSKT